MTNREVWGVGATLKVFSLPDHFLFFQGNVRIIMRSLTCTIVARALAVAKRSSYVPANEKEESKIIVQCHSSK